MAAGNAGMLGKALEPWDLGNTACIIKTIPKDLFAELCEKIIQYLQCQVPGVNTEEMCGRFQAAGIEINVSDLVRVVNVVSSLFSTAAKNHLSAEEPSNRLDSVADTLPKQAAQVVRHLWNEHGQSFTLSEDAKNVATVGQLIDFQWKLGMAVRSDSCRSLKYPYVTMALKVADPSGQIMSKFIEMTIPQFQNFFRQFKEMAAVLETV
uniref:COMM domain-containing protein 6 n=1 Tax=Sphenodon punctatus TaxID=8508 RepID=A0A8D0H5Z1_SPHPU